MGAELFGGMMQGAAPALLCAMKSLPTYDVVASTLPNQAGLLRNELQTVAKFQVRVGGVLLVRLAAARRAVSGVYWFAARHAWYFASTLDHCSTRDQVQKQSTNAGA